MDKNFVNIDDLVRQRLGGGEEQERSGAWLRMQDLLDKEMPKDKFVGMIYWRRMLSAVAVLLLVATITVGGYELSAYRNGTGHNAVTAPVTAAPSATAHTTNASIASNEVTNTQLSATGIAGNSTAQKNETHNKPHHKKLIAANETNNTTAAANHNNNDKKEIDRSSVASNKKSGSSSLVNDKKANDNKAVAAINNKVNDNNIDNDKKATNTVAVGKSDSKKETAEAVAVAEHKNNKRSVTKVAVPAAKNNNDVSVAKDIAIKTPAVAGVPARKTAKSADMPAKSVPVKAADNKAVAANHNPVAKTNGKEAKTAPQKGEDIHKLALGSSVPDAAAKKSGLPAQKVPASPAKIGDKVMASNLALNGHAPAAKHVADVKIAKITDTKKAADKTGNIAGKDNKAVAGNGAPIVAAANKASKNPVVSNLPKTSPKPSGNNAVANKAATKPLVVNNNTSKGKKFIQKINLLERYVKLSPTEGYFHMDTISMESLTQDLGTDHEDEPFYPAVAKKKGTGGIAGNENNDNAAKEDAQILPGASATANGKSALGNKEKAVTKKSSGSGTTAIENLTAAFNDIKYKASGVKFAPGLAAGINGTFFGPNSFKGFQFGFTGNFTFDGQWSIITALEYFHRINGSYAMYDNYYTYSQSGSGYNKVAQSYSYSFSTLHSIEMPVAARYTSGNFSFFAGGNFVYNFGVNTGRAPEITNQTPIYSPTQGNDNIAKLDAGSFGARFGIGCLFGISYQVTPKVTLDLRNVQTVWDNSKSSGSKYVSDQLYKSPSLQFSLGYRFGGAKK